jgi:hypothetical protein
MTIKRVILKALLLTMLLNDKTNASEIEARKISAGEEAPYGGILMPPAQFMFFDSEVAACRKLQAEPPPCVAETDYKGLATVGVFSFSLGALLGAFAK